MKRLAIAWGLAGILLASAVQAGTGKSWYGKFFVKPSLPRIKGSIEIPPGAVTSTPATCYRYVYSSAADGIIDLYRRDTCGGERVKLTNNVESQYSIARDVRTAASGEATIAFFGFTRYPAIRTQIGFINEDGSEADTSLLTQYRDGIYAFLPWMEASFASDGRIVFLSLSQTSATGGNSMIRWGDLALYMGDSRESVTLDASPSMNPSDPFYHKVIFSTGDAGQGLKVLNMDTLAVSFLRASETSDAAFEGFSPSISRDGRMAFLRRTEENLSQVWTCDLGASSADGPYYCRNAVRLPLEGVQGSVAWTTDDRKIFFTGCSLSAATSDMASMASSGGCYIAMANPDGSLVERLNDEADPGAMPVPLPPKLPTIPPEYLKDIRTSPAAPSLRFR
ncbi:MAG TPA: hypothetical protein VFX30_05215 [bacterium]|nr:hypothetical protein [bacterium]